MNRNPDPTWAVIGVVCCALLIVLALAFMATEVIRFHRRKTPGYTGFISMRSITRRITGSVLLIGLGLMLYAGLAVIDFSDSPMLFSVYWIVCCLLAFMLFLLGLMDFREVREHRLAHQLKLLWQMTRGISRKE